MIFAPEANIALPLSTAKWFLKTIFTSRNVTVRFPFNCGREPELLLVEVTVRMPEPVNVRELYADDFGELTIKL